MPSLTLSKSTYIRGLQCEKSLYLHKRYPELRNPLNDHQETIFSQGNSIGILAQRLFPNGKDCSFNDFSEIKESLANTKRYIDQGERVIYEAAFKYDDVLVFVDILVNDRNGWKMYEVKSSTSVKGTYISDVSLQAFVLKNCGIKLVDINVVHINSQYVRNGELEIDRLFSIVSVKEEIEQRLHDIPQSIDNMRQYLVSDQIPAKEIGDHCGVPYPCDFSNYCWQHVQEKSVFDIRGMRSRKMFQLYEEGITQMVDIPDDVHITDKQRLQIEGEKTGQVYIDVESIQDFIGSLNYPLFFLDFETLGPAVPLFDFTSPYRQFPFQYSLHILRSPDVELEHYEFLAKTDGSDPRIYFIQQLIRDCEKYGDVVVYNQGFEKGKLRDLASTFPNYREELKAIHDRVVDLMLPFQKGWYYTPAMKGSHSIKVVLPALVPDMCYSQLAIANGGTASNIFETMANGSFEGDIEQTRADLLAYCEMDTLAMVKILEKLREIVSN